MLRRPVELGPITDVRAVISAQRGACCPEGYRRVEAANAHAQLEANGGQRVKIYVLDLRLVPTASKFAKACETVERFRQLEGGVPPSVPLNTCEDDFGAAKLKA